MLTSIVNETHLLLFSKSLYRNMVVWEVPIKYNYNRNQFCKVTRITFVTLHSVQFILFPLMQVMAKHWLKLSIEAIDLQ